MQRWEYKTAKVTCGGGEEDPTEHAQVLWKETLDLVGNEGWELVAEHFTYVLSHNTARYWGTLKRPLP